MKLLFDQNLSHELAVRLKELYPDSVHVREVGLNRASDEAVWRFATDHHFTIVSKDSDFHQRAFLFGAPPKIIWIRSGNCTTEDIEHLLRTRCPEILKFDEDPALAFLLLE